MRIVGLSCGRKNGNNELLLKRAMTEAKRLSGAELEIVRLQELTIRDCVGCETCMRGLTTGGDGLCVIRDDDMGWLADTIKDADALLLEFGERGYRAYSAYSLIDGKGTGDGFTWTDPAPAGEMDPLL